MKERNVLVTGAGGPSGQAAIRMLKDRGFRVTAVDMVAVPHLADDFFLVPPAADTRFMEHMTSLCMAQQIGWLLPTVQDELVLVASHAEALRQQGIAVYVASPEAVTICNDKWLTASRLMDAGIPVPRSTIDEPGSPAVTALGFPCLSKPRVGRGGRNVVVHEGDVYETVGSDVVWQEFLPGTEYDVMLCIGCGHDAGKAVVHVMEKTALREGRTGNALDVRPVHAADVADLALAAAKAVGLTGPADMDIRRDHKGVARLLEINARIGAHTQRAPHIMNTLVAHYELGHLSI